MLAKYIHEANADYRRIRQQIPLGPLRTKAEYHRAVAVVDDIIDEIGEDDSHSLADLAETLHLPSKRMKTIMLAFRMPLDPPSFAR
jgi:hypothetical protein